MFQAFKIDYNGLFKFLTAILRCSNMWLRLSQQRSGYLCDLWILIVITVLLFNMVNTPIPSSLKSEAKKAAKILRDFTIPNAKAGPDKIIPGTYVSETE